MSNSDEMTDGAIADSNVSALYRATAVESSPRRLDQQVLQQATREAKAGSGPVALIGWLRPVTFVATAGLCVALLFEFGEIQDHGAPIDVLTTMPGFSADRVMPGSPSAVRADIEPAKNVESPESERSTPSGASDNARNFRRAASETAGQVRAVESAADATLQEMPKEVALQEIAASEARAPDTSRRCTDEQRNDAEEWWSCINELRTAGLESQAQAEIRSFRDTYPSFPTQ